MLYSTDVMAKRSKTKLAAQAKEESCDRPRSDYLEQRTKEFDASLRCIDVTDRGRILAALQNAFMPDLRAGVPLAELQSRHKYKALQGEAKKWKVMQIRAIGAYRVSLTIVRELSPATVYWLNVWRRRNKGGNDKEIAVAVNAAKQIRERLK
jgi:hypothetical protein